jgi:hypothetical protein
MKRNKNIFIFNIKDVIQANLSLQTVQRNLKQNFGLNNYDIKTVLNEKYINIYKSWDEEKRKLFISTIGGKANFSKTKCFIEDKINEVKQS